MGGQEQVQVDSPSPSGQASTFDWALRIVCFALGCALIGAMGIFGFPKNFDRFGLLGLVALLAGLMLPLVTKLCIRFHLI